MCFGHRRSFKGKQHKLEEQNGTKQVLIFNYGDRFCIFFTWHTFLLHLFYKHFFVMSMTFNSLLSKRKCTYHNAFSVRRKLIQIYITARSTPYVSVSNSSNFKHIWISSSYHLFNHWLNVWCYESTIGYLLQYMFVYSTGIELEFKYARYFSWVHNLKPPS